MYREKNECNSPWKRGETAITSALPQSCARAHCFEAAQLLLWFPLPSFCAHLRTHRYNTALQLPLSWMKLRAGASKTSYVRQERSSRAAEPRFAGSAQFSPWVLASWCWLLTHCSPRKGAESPREGIFPRGSNFLFHFSCSFCCTQGVCQHVLCKPVAVSLTGRHLNEEPLSKR